MLAKKSKIDFGSIQNGSAAPDLPPEGPKKERWAISCAYAYLDAFSNSDSRPVHLAI